MTTDRVEHTHRVRSYELDPYKHANNGAYINWLEDGREQFLRAQQRDYNFYPETLSTWFVVVKVSQATRICQGSTPAFGPSRKNRSTTSSEIRSHTLSGWPSDTDSLVK